MLSTEKLSEKLPKPNGIELISERSNCLLYYDANLNIFFSAFSFESSSFC